MSASLPTLALLLVPVVTGFASVLWSLIAAASWRGRGGRPARASGAVGAAGALARPGAPGLAEVACTVGWPVSAGFAASSAVVSLLWFWAHKRTGVVWIAFTEAGLGFAALLILLALARVPESAIQTLAVTPIRCVGGVLVVAGAVVLALAGRGESVSPTGAP